MGSIPPPYNAYDPPRPYSNASASRAPSSRGFPDGAMDHEQHPAPLPPMSMNDGSFDILEWHPAHVSCQRYFIDHAQYEPGTQAVCALINIRLPHQWMNNPVTASSPPQTSSQGVPTGGSAFNFNAFSRSASHNDRSPSFVSPIPYIRRLVVTGFDKAAILHGFFGDDYKRGILPHVECERRNYLFAAKHGGWRSCKKQYDAGSGGGGDETVPFMKPLDEAKIEELDAAEKAWSSWLAMEDWMVGPRAPADDEYPSPNMNTRSAARGGSVSTRGGALQDGAPSDGI